MIETHITLLLMAFLTMEIWSHKLKKEKQKSASNQLNQVGEIKREKKKKEGEGGREILCNIIICSTTDNRCCLYMNEQQ